MGRTLTGWVSNTAEPLTDAERRFDELLAQGRTAESTTDRAAPAGIPGAEQQIRGEYLAARLVESLEDGGRLFSRRGAQPLVIVVEHASITGQLDLRNVDLPYLLEFVGCRFETAPDLRQARLAGLVLWHCRFPGVHARNLAVSNDVVLRDCASVGGILDLAE